MDLFVSFVAIHGPCQPTPELVIGQHQRSILIRFHVKPTSCPLFCDPRVFDSNASNWLASTLMQRTTKDRARTPPPWCMSWLHRPTSYSAQFDRNGWAGPWLRRLPFFHINLPSILDVFSPGFCDYQEFGKTFIAGWCHPKLLTRSRSWKTRSLVEYSIWLATSRIWIIATLEWPDW